MSGCSETLTGEFARTVSLVKEQYKRDKKIFRGRHLIRLVRLHFRGSAEGERSAAILKLTGLKLTGGIAALQGYINSFDSYIMKVGSANPPDNDTLLSALLPNVKGLESLKLFFERRDEAEIGDPIRGYPALRSKVDQILNKRREASITAAVDEAERQNAAGQGVTTKTLPAAEKQGKAEQQTKGKAVKQERSSSAPAEPALVSGVKGKGKGKGAECFEFRDSGTCKFGDKCHFEHSNSAKAGKGDSTPRPKASAKPKAKAKSKTASQPGSRTNSPGNTPPASPRSTELCNHFKRGTCTKGDKCRYSHAEVAAVAHALLRNSAAVAGSKGK